jgi:ribosomal protein S18 acetylase RimI-like enzyme
MVHCHTAAFPGQTMTEMGPRWLSALYGYYLNHPLGIAVVAVEEREAPASAGPPGAAGFGPRGQPGQAPRRRCRGASPQPCVGFVIGGGPDIRAEFLRRARFRLAHVILWRALTRPLVRRRILSRIASTVRGGRPDPQSAAHREAELRQTRLGTLLSIGVLPQAQGTGIAAELVRSFCDLCRQRGFGYLELGVYTSNARAIAFYRKRGWQEIGSTDDQTFFGLDITDQPLDGTGSLSASAGRRCVKGQPADELESQRETGP